MTSASSSAKPPEGTPAAPAPAAPTAPVAQPADSAPGNGHREAIAGLPFRQLPAPTADWLRHGNTPGESQPVVLMHQTALLQVNAHSRSRLDCELGGALLGHAYRYKTGVVVEVKAALPAVSSDHGPVHFTFSADSWARLHRDRTAHYAQLDIVGWFHTHPDLGVFYSSDDVVVHSAAFTQPWHVGLVVDPVREEAAFFGWVDGALRAFNGFYELRERQPESVMPWRAVRTAIADAASGRHGLRLDGHGGAVEALAWSADGRWLASVAQVGVQAQIFVDDLSGSHGRWQVTTQGGLFPHWTRQGREIVYETVDGRLMAVALDTRAGFQSGAPQQLFALPMRSPLGAAVSNWACDATGTQFFVMQPAAATNDDPIEVVSGFEALVHRK